MAQAADDEKDEDRKHEGDICDTYSDFNAEYTRIKKLGRTGQYGETHLCTVNGRDAESSTPDNPYKVAVKIINKQRFKQSGERIYNKWKELQRNEITTLLLTRHPNIVRLYRVMEDEEHVYMIMEYLPGGELLHFITRTGKLSEYKVAHIIGQVLSALDYMHQRDIIHLDLKPENIMLADDSEDAPTVKLIDFGFAAILPRLEKMVGHRGTPYYMAPEVWKGTYDRAADVWAVGVICFVMLFGFLPFYDDHARQGKPNTKEIKRQIQKGFTNNTKKGCGAWFPRSIPVSGGAKRFIAHMLRKDIGRRYTVVEALGDPWCRGHASQDTLPNIVMRGLAQFVGAKNENRALATIAAGVASLPSDALERVGSFEALYTIDGKMNVEEFIHQFGALCDMRVLEMQSLFEELDTDHDGFITIDTVKRVEAFHRMVSVDDRLQGLFDKLDKDGDGVLNDNDLEQAMERLAEKGMTVEQVMQVRQLLESSDLKQSGGVIDRDAFMQALHPQNYSVVVESVREARTASNYAVSLRQRSAMYYALLQQCETQDTATDLTAELRAHLGGNALSLNLEEIAESPDEDESDDADGSLDVGAVLANVPASNSMTSTL